MAATAATLFSMAYPFCLPIALPEITAFLRCPLRRPHELLVKRCARFRRHKHDIAHFRLIR
jgi:hypothetical protein